MVFVTCYPPGLHLATRTQLSHATMCLLAEQVYRAIAVRQSELAAMCIAQAAAGRPEVQALDRVATPRRGATSGARRAAQAKEKKITSKWA